MGETREGGDSPESRRAGAFVLSHGLVERVVKGLAVVHQGVWLGLLDRAELNDVTRRAYGESSPYLATTYNQSGLRAWEAALIDHYFGQCRSVLVGAAGSGREVIVLCQRGMVVEAFDCSEPLVEQGRRLLAAHGLKAPLLLARPDEVPDALGTYDGIIMGWGGYGHIVGRRARVALLGALRPHIRTNGPLLISFGSREQAPRIRLYRGVLAIARTIRWMRRSHDPVELGDVLPHGFAHRFTKDEVEGELREGGFRPTFFADVDYGVAIAHAAETGAARSA